MHHVVRHRKLAVFGCWCLETMRQHVGDDIDGGEAQDKAEELGLLERVTVTEPCSPNCWCSEYHGEFPVECLREPEAFPEGTE